MAKQQKYYVVWEGLVPGIYDDWKKCEAQVKNYQGARYKSFETLDEATTAYTKGPYSGQFKKSVIKKKNFSNIVKDSIAVDAACEGNPGPLEYQGINPHNGEKLFHMGPYSDGTVNLGEFLAIVHALAMLKKLDNNHTAIYSDSITGISWVRNKKIKTTLERTSRNKPIFDLVDRALHWLNTNIYKNPILKWETEHWGENPADFGRK
ncbi:MAG: ribonuclease H family protein [Saprospiraceae bacterium]